MRDRYRLQGLRDADLISALPLLVQKDNEHTADLLAHLAELDARKLYLDLGFRSMWEYCTLGLGFCETSAWRRYTAARVCRRFPAVFAKVALGELQLSVLAALAKHLTVDNAGELFEASRGQSIRKVEELIAARFPAPDVRDSVRRLPERARPMSELAESTRRSEPASTSGAGCDLLATPMEVEKALVLRPVVVTRGAAEPAPPRPPARETVEPLSADRFSVRFTADAEFLALLEEVRDLASHRTTDGDLLSTMKRAMGAYRTELLKQRFAVGRRPRVAEEIDTTPTAVAQTTVAQTAVAQTDRHEPRAQNTREHQGGRRLTNRRAPAATVMRAVYERDGGQCTYLAPDGRRCSGRRSLELDHIEPHAVGGGETPDNLRMRCRAHNQRCAQQYFGKGYMKSVIKRAQR